MKYQGKNTEQSMTDQCEPEDAITETQRDPMYEEIPQKKPATDVLTENIAYAPFTQ